jgi:hypothetical protein
MLIFLTLKEEEENFGFTTFSLNTLLDDTKDSFALLFWTRF